MFVNLPHLPALPMLAAPLDAIREHWGKTTVPVGWTVAAIALLALAIGGAWAIGWYRRRHERAQPLAVFRQLAAVGGLSLAEQWLLWRIARQQRLPGPATLLMSARTLRVHGSAFVRQTLWARAKRLRRVAGIRRKLMGRAR